MFRIILLFLVLIPVAHSVCPEGSFIDESNNNACSECPLSTYNNRIDAESCIKCPNGGFTDHYGSTSVTECKDCPPGMEIDEHEECFTCDPGTYNPFLNSRKCFKCPKGTYSNSYNPTYCSPCRPGRVNNKRDAALCKRCKGNKYQPLLGQKFCIQCPEGTVTNPDGASCRPTCNPEKTGCKICPEGKEMNEDGTCVKCPEGTINAHPSVTKCQPCPDASRVPAYIPSVLVPNKSRTRCICRPGEYLDLTEPFSPTKLNPGCLKCPGGKSSNGIKCFK